MLRIIAAATYKLCGVCAETQAAFERALTTARDTGMKWYELRIATDLSEYLSAAQKPAEAVSVLKPVIDGLSEGAEMPDMKRARAMIEALQQPERIVV